MNILLIGSGGREHALGWKIAQSPLCTRLVMAPGNPGMKALGECRDIRATDVGILVTLAREIHADLVVVGPESALDAGLADALAEAGIACFGPSKAASQLETSKAFTKSICDQANVPTAAYGRFEAVAPARAWLEARPAPYVIKADGLAAGKGVVIASTLDEAVAAVEEMLGGRFGEASSSLVIEEFMAGEEASVFALCDGDDAILFGWAQDHKRAYDGDQGPNTGGMGTYSPAPVVTPDILDQTLNRMVRPTLKALAAQGMPYRGVLYSGLMIDQGQARLVEYNARFGDPECQVLMLRLKSDIVPYLKAAASGGLAGLEAPQWSDEDAVCVVYAAKGYPDTPVSGTGISGLEAAAKAGAQIFHAGTRMGAKGEILAAGGRVLNICATGTGLAAARRRAYEAIARIEWSEGFYRTDIGVKGL